MAATPMWFGPKTRRLFGWLHLPADSAVSGGIVLCPPLAIEAICTYFTYRTVAERLADEGIAVLRFDYDGTGDSVGDLEDEERVAAWRSSVDEAIRLLRSWGAPKIGIGGIRVGALLAADAATRRPVDALILWDTCLSGRTFLREQLALQGLSLGVSTEVDGSVEAPGTLFPKDVVRDLSGVDLLKMAPPTAGRTLVLDDPDKPRSSRLTRWLGASSFDRYDAVGQAELLDPPRQKTPWSTIDLVTDWVVGALSGERVRISAPDRDAEDTGGVAVVGYDAGGGEITERVVELGPAALFGIVTEPPHHVDGPTVVFVNEGNTPHIGQSRMWVQLAREWARSGVRSLRFDLSGNGDSPVRPGGEPHTIRAPEAFDDVADAMRGVAPHDLRNTVLIGLCSGAYQAAEAALTLRPAAVCLVNPVFTFTLAEERVDPRRRARQSTRPWFVRIAEGPTRWAARRHRMPEPDRWLRSLEIANWPPALARRYPQVPNWTWRATRRAFLRQPAADTVRFILEQDVDVLLVSCAEDLLPISMGAAHVMRRLQAHPRFTLEVPAGLDHAGLRSAQRTVLLETLTRYLVGRYGETNARERPAHPRVSA